jgi:hypothetical protein
VVVIDDGWLRRFVLLWSFLRRLIDIWHLAGPLVFFQGDATMTGYPLFGFSGIPKTPRFIRSTHSSTADRKHCGGDEPTGELSELR